MRIRFHCLLLLMILLYSCGTHPPIVFNVSEIHALPEDEFSLHAASGDEDLYALERLKNLHYLWLDVRPYSRITDRGLEILSSLDLPKLELLSVMYNKNITNEGLSYISEMESLTWLSLAACPKISDEGLRRLATMSSLEGLDIRGCLGITDEGLQYLAKMKNLRHVLLGGCPHITDDGVRILQAELPNASVEKNDKEWFYLIRQ